jgi:tRNA A-37 threonylcarbamoyl transferase component Bud32
LLGNRYRLVERLGQGGMGTVWRAYDEVMERDVAVKEPRLHTHMTDLERNLAFARLQREARAAAQIGHPSVITIHDVVSVGGSPWIVMERIRGRTLADRLAEGTLPAAEAARIALAIARALAAAHDHKVLHRDVKPSNIMLDDDGRVVLTDFGIAYIEGEQRLTRTGTFVGAPEYMAPERVNGQMPGPESDFFSLGVLLYRAIEGRSPFGCETPQATLRAVLHLTPEEPTKAGELKGLIMRLLSKEPNERPTSGQIISALESATGQATLVLSPLTLEDRTGTGRRGWVRFVGAAAIGFLAGMAVVFVVTRPEPTQSPTTAKPSVASNVPKGWKVYRKLGASLAIPANYQVTDLYDHGGGTAFQMKRGQPHGELLLLHWDVPEGSPAERASYWYRQYRNNKKFAGRQITLADAMVDGRGSKVLTMTYHPDGVHLWRKRELFYNAADGQLWKIVVDWAIDREQDTGGDDLFEGALNTFQTD